jgi:hypothetical protein
MAVTFFGYFIGAAWLLWLYLYYIVVVVQNSMREEEGRE